MLSISNIKQVKNDRGFTLVELIVVLVILAVLAAILVPTLLGWINKAKDSVVIDDAAAAREASQSVIMDVVGRGYAMNWLPGGTSYNDKHKDQWAAKDKSGSAGSYLYPMGEKVSELAGVDDAKCALIWIGFDTAPPAEGLNSDGPVSIDHFIYAETVEGSEITSNGPYYIALYSAGNWTSYKVDSKSELNTKFKELKGKAMTSSKQNQSYLIRNIH